MIQALALLLTSSLVCVGLLSAWAATSPRHWFLRTGALVALLSLLLLIPAYEPFVAFVLQGAVVAIGVQCARRWRRRKEDGTHSPSPRRTRFSLATLLLLTVFVAIAAAVIANLPGQGWGNEALVGLVAGLATLLGLWAIFGQRFRLWLRITLALFLSLGMSFLLVWRDGYVSLFLLGATLDSTGTLIISWPVAGVDPSVIWTPIIVCLVCCISVFIWLLAGVHVTGTTAVTNLRHFNNRGKRVLVRFVLFLLIVTIVVPPATVYYQLMTPLPIPQTVLPDPNGWDDLVAAGKVVDSSSHLKTINFYDTVTQAQLATAVEAMAPAYERIKIGLDKRVQCPVDYNDSVFNNDSLSFMRSLSRALAGRARLAEIVGRFGESAEFSLEGIRFGYAFRRGGLVTESLVGNACSGIGRWDLYNILEELTAPQCSKLIASLRKLERQAEPEEDMAKRHQIFDQHAYGWQGHFIEILGVADHLYPYSLEKIFRSERAEMRLLRVELAIQAWQITHGSLPETLRELVPQYLDEIPADPFDPSNGPLQYRRTDEGYVLYSVGYNGIDDGGVPPDEADIGGYISGDLRLDILYAPDPEPAVDDAMEDEDWMPVEEDKRIEEK